MRELPVRVVRNPSRDFTRTRELPVRGPDVTVSFDVYGEDQIRARMHGPAVPALYSMDHKAILATKPSVVRDAGARLRRRWKEFVDFQPLDEHGREDAARIRPFASAVDLRDHPEAMPHVRELADMGAHLLFRTLLRGDGPGIDAFRGYLAEALASTDLRVRFDSDLQLPWPLLALPSRDVPDDEVFARFLGHRHQIEHTHHSYVYGPGAVEPRPAPLVSLNHDPSLGTRGRTRAEQVAAALAEGGDCVSRTTRTELTQALKSAERDEQFMYFWGHGRYVPQESAPPAFAIALGDGLEIDGLTILECRDGQDWGTSPFRPFVLMNACHGTAPGPAGSGRLSLAGALIESGALGVLGPLIEMPQVFAAEYALAFITEYLRGTATAGALAHTLTRRYAAEFANPLGLAYGLLCGMDSRLERAS
ncbi:CHAT domain-containing protein [Streptomyces sp. NPDC000410]|uniref:CHAT domain-containing protein n=1 Tax=Streptomyces sp. NPDC000410 TaxID=3154254 RepID=UPI00331897F7